jgi:ornithine cyclodeaminase/alanine dehydrogenase-like protein (mu-crystallin family)
MKLLTRSMLQQCLSMADTIEAMSDAFGQLSSGAANVPLRIGIPAGDGISLFMPAHLRESHALGMKLVSVHSGNTKHGMPAILAIVALVDENTGEPLALMDGAYVTAMRTAAGSGLATKLMARTDAKIATIIGAGPQGRAHILAMLEARPLNEIRVVSRTTAVAQQLVDELQATTPCALRVVTDTSEAVRGADIVCLCTSAHSPIFNGADLKAGAHVNGIGSHAPAQREIGDDAIVRFSKIIVDSRSAALKEAGDLIIPINAGLIKEDAITGELGELVLGKKLGRAHDDEITLFKSVGNAAQDVAAARVAFAKAQQMGIGMAVDLLA